MKKLSFIIPMSLLIALPLSAQTATDVFSITSNDLKGTARFMSMGGAFGALGGDLSTLSQNPAGIGVYRSNEIGFTLDLDCQRSTATSQGFANNQSQTKFLLNNIGGVATIKLGSSVLPNFNLGFTYNKGASFNRKYSGGVPHLSNSLTNYIAGIANSNQLTVGDVLSSGQYDPYNPSDGGFQAPWLTILGYDSYFISPQGDPDNPHWVGQWGDGTSGSGRFSVEETGGIDEYNIAFGGNISNTVYWGMNFDIISVNYTRNSWWGESLDDAVLSDDNGKFSTGRTNWTLHNYYNLNGSGFNYQLGLIVKPIQELRLGFAFHTPTWYTLTENFYADTNCKYPDTVKDNVISAVTNNDEMAYNDFNFRTPWRLIASVAGVIGGRFILSADYEWEPKHTMHISAPGNYGGYGYDDGWYDDGLGWWGVPSKKAPAYTRSLDYNDPYALTNQDIENYYSTTNTLRLGAEFRITPRFSVRAGYSLVSSPVKKDVRDNKVGIATGLCPAYELDNTTNYITCGLGYRYQKFYVDMAYVFRHQSATYHAYTPDPSLPNIQSPQAQLSLNSSQVVLSAGFKF